MNLSAPWYTCEDNGAKNSSTKYLCSPRWPERLYPPKVIQDLIYGKILNFFLQNTEYDPSLEVK